MVAPLTGTIRAIPTGIPLGPEQGIDRDAVASFDTIASVPRSLPTNQLGGLGPTGRHQICVALDALADC